MTTEEHNRRANLWLRIFKIVNSEIEYWEGERDRIPLEDNWGRGSVSFGALQALENVLTKLKDEVTK